MSIKKIVDIAKDSNSILSIDQCVTALQEEVAGLKTRLETSSKHQASIAHLAKKLADVAGCCIGLMDKLGYSPELLFKLLLKNNNHTYKPYGFGEVSAININSCKYINIPDSVRSGNVNVIVEAIDQLRPTGSAVKSGRAVLHKGGNMLYIKPKAGNFFVEELQKGSRAFSSYCLSRDELICLLNKRRGWSICY